MFFRLKLVLRYFALGNFLHRRQHPLFQMSLKFDYLYFSKAVTTEVSH